MSLNIDDDDDDDFGDLYADVEFQTNTSVLNSSPKVLAPARVDLIGEDFNLLSNEEANSVREYKENNSNGSDDSEDDLNIVLNDDDGLHCGPGILGAQNSGINLGEEDGKDEDEPNGGDESQTEQTSNSGYKQYKYRKPQSAAFPNNSLGNGVAELASHSSSKLVRGDWEDNGCNQRMGCSFVRAQSGHNNFSLPWSRTILDVNMDALERKPWRHPGVDISNFFNFGFDEDSWKHYCNHLDHYRQQTSMSKRIKPSEYSQVNKAYEALSEHEMVAQKVVSEKSTQIKEDIIVSPPPKSEMPKGRAIQVEERIFERQPSMDVRRPLYRDSNVVIQIRVQDLKDSSSSAKKGLGRINSSHQESENGDFDVDDSRDALCFSSASEDEDDFPIEYLQGNGDGLDTSIPERSSQQEIPSNPICIDSDNHERVQICDDGHNHQEIAICESETTAEAMKTSNNSKERVGMNTCNTSPSILGTESSHGEHGQHSPSSSCSGGQCKSFRHGALIDPDKSYNHHVIRQSSDSVTEIRESVASDYYHSKDSKRHGMKIKAGNSRYNTRNRSHIREDVNHHIRRFHGVSEWKNHPDNDASPFCDTEGLYDVHHSAVDDRRQNKWLHHFGSPDGQDVPYYKESELSFNYCGEKFSHHQVGSVYPRNLHWKNGHQSFGYETDQDLSRYMERGEYFYEQRMLRVDDEVMERDWYHSKRRQAVQDTGPPTCESRWSILKYSSRIGNERGIRWKRKGDELQFRKRMRNDDVMLEHNYGDDLMLEKHKKPAPCDDRERGYLEHKYEKHLPYATREVKSPKRSKRRYGNPSMALDNSWSIDDEDEYWRYMDRHQFLASCSYEGGHTTNGRRWHDTRSPRNDMYERNGRYGRHSREGSDSNWFDIYTNAFDPEERFNNRHNQVHFGRRSHHSRSELKHWSDDEYMSMHQNDKFGANGASFSFERTSRQKHFDAKHGSDHVRKLIDERQVEWGRHKPISEENSDNRFDRRSDIISRGSHDQTVLRCGVSLGSDLVVGKGKPSGRRSKAGSVMYHGRHVITDWHIDLEQKTSDDVNESHAEKVTQVDDPHVETSQNDDKWLDKLPVMQHNGALEIEEGQIITEEINENPMEKISASKDVRQISDVKKLHGEKANNGDTVVEGYDNPRILEVIAKMEKRRERFKEPITMKKDTDKVPNPPANSVVGLETGKTTQQRPTRKRRWGGS